MQTNREEVHPKRPSTLEVRAGSGSHGSVNGLFSCKDSVDFRPISSHYLRYCSDCTFTSPVTIKTIPSFIGETSKYYKTAHNIRSSCTHVCSSRSLCRIISLQSCGLSENVHFSDHLDISWSRWRGTLAFTSDHTDCRGMCFPIVCFLHAITLYQLLTPKFSP